MPRSEAQKRADKKYIAKTYKRYAVNVRKEIAETIDAYCAEHNLSGSAAFTNAIRYCIENDIDIAAYTPESEREQR